jgi:hypothetical protein
MKKAYEALQDQVKKNHIIIEVRDARVKAALYAFLASLASLVSLVFLASLASRTSLASLPSAPLSASSSASAPRTSLPADTLF